MARREATGLDGRCRRVHNPAMVRPSVVVAAAVACVAARPADACSIRSDLRIVPTDFEEVELSYAVVVAEIDAPRLGDRQHPQLVPFIVREVFQGPLTPLRTLEAF